MKEFPAGSSLIEKEGKYLMIFAKNGFAAKRWNNPGGMLEPGESFEDAVVRETKEEVGLDVVVSHRIGRYFFYDTENNNFLNKVICKVDVVGGDITLQPSEIEKYQWFTKEELEQAPEGVTPGALLSIEHFEAGLRDQEVEVYDVP